jgi:hypothetical protein
MKYILSKSVTLLQKYVKYLHLQIILRVFLYLSYAFNNNKWINVDLALSFLLKYIQAVKYSLSAKRYPRDINLLHIFFIRLGKTQDLSRLVLIFPPNPQGEQKERSHKRLGKHKSLVLELCKSILPVSTPSKQTA